MVPKAETPTAASFDQPPMNVMYFLDGLGDQTEVVGVGEKGKPSASVSVITWGMTLWFGNDVGQVDSTNFIASSKRTFHESHGLQAPPERLFRRPRPP